MFNSLVYFSRFSRYRFRKCRTMSKRKLNRRQAWRIQKIQKDRLARVQRRTKKMESLTETQSLGPEQIGTVVAHYGANLNVEDSQGQVFHCLIRANLPKLVCGDRVVWQLTGEDQGIVVSLVPRESLLSRPDPHKQLKPVAANIDQILVVSAPQPGMDEDIINRYLVACELTQINAVLVINKTDLLNKKTSDKLAEQLAIYQQLGYPVIHTSTREQNGLAALQKILKNNTSIFVGQSGVGKSSLIKEFIPDADIQVGELSKSTGLGKHTTSVTVLYHMQQGGNIIDSPGVREFGLDHLSPEELANGFREFHALLGQCKFKDCRHDQEPDCAIKQAVNSGSISRQRYSSYQRLMKSLGRR